MSDYLDKIQTQKKDGTPLATVPFRDSEAREDITTIQNELTTDTTTIEGNPLNFTTLSAQTTKSTILSVEPIQDLHGYDKPWVGGAGKNLYIGSPVFDSTWTNYNYWTKENEKYNGHDVYSCNLQWKGLYKNLTLPVGTYTFSCMVKTTDVTTIGIYIITNTTTSTLSPVNTTFTSSTSWTKYSFTFTVTVAGTVAPRLENSLANDVKVYVSEYQLEKASSATSYEPYENICPISGRSEIGILGCGKNLLPLTDRNVTTSNYAISIQNGEISITKIGTWAENKAYNLASFTLPVGEYKINGCGDIDRQSDKPYCTLRNASNNAWIANLGDDDYTLTVTDSTFEYKVQLIMDKSLSLTGKITPMLRKSSNTNTFEPYQSSNSLTISLGQTVYGGTIDVENGVLVVDRVIDDLSTLDFSLSTPELNVFRSSSLEGIIKPQDTNLDLPLAICESYYPMGYNPITRANNGAFSVADKTNTNAGRLVIIDHRFSTISDFTTGVTGQKICYELATPITINLTPHTINLLKGVNNISTDGDKITLTYRNGKFATLDGAVPKMTFRGEDYTMGVDDIGLFLENLTKSTKTYIADPLLNFDGTAATYKKIMKQWFINNGVNIMDSAGITYLCERWYEITKQGWKGGTSFPAVGVSTGSTGTRFDDNVGMSVTPSTDTSANTDTYQGLPLFAITDCNWELDSDGNILITAIDGITDNFVRDDPTKFVGVMQQTGWVKKVDDASTQKYYYADDKDAYEDLVPLPEAIKLNGTVRSFVVHAKYMSGIVDSKMTCCSGVIPRRNISHDSLITLPDNIGTQYSGGTSVDWSFLVWMQRIKYASLTSDGVLQGCCNYNYQYYVKVGETGVKRLILSSANGANLKVGSTVTFGAYAGNDDRGQAATYSISGQDGAIITSIEDVTIDGTTYKAVYVNTTSTFTTVANGDATNGTTIVSTHHWVSGSCDNVKGNDGSPVSATNGVYPAKLQGIEYMVGGYEVFADVIMNISGGYYNPYYARKSTDQATSISSAMVQSTLKCAQPSSDTWRYIQKHGFDGEIFYPVSTGTSSSEYMKDGFYENGTSTSTGTREWLAFGNLNFGSGNAGLSFLNGVNTLSHGRWFCVARLSCNGNRGILLTA